MFRTIIRGMLAHKLRLFLTTAAISLGVAFLAGTLILTDTMHTAFDRLFAGVSSGTDAVVRQQSALDLDGSGTRQPVPAALLGKVRAVDGVRAAEGVVSGYALITDTKGHAVSTSGGAPTLGMSLPVDRDLRGNVTLRSGHQPHGPGEVAIDARTSEEHHIPVGARVKVLFHGPTRTFTVVGVTTFGAEKDLGGAPAAYSPPAPAQAPVGTPGKFAQIDVTAVPGVSAKDLVARIESAVPAGVEARTDKQIAKEFADNVTAS